MERSESTSNKKLSQLNLENKENIQPERQINFTFRRIPNINNNNNHPEESEEGQFKYLKRKINRTTLDNSELDFRNNESNLVNSNLRKKVSNLLKETKYSFSQNIEFNFNSVSRFDLLKKNETRIILTIIKSNINLPMINTTYVITERGLPCSQKTHNTHYISIGRQQINDQGIRPNDIMLFPTDPSISRSHFKLYHKEFYEALDLSKNRMLTMMMLTIAKCKKIDGEQIPGSYYNGLNSNEIYHIMKYIPPPKKIAIEDNGTIYGTYYKVKSFSVENFLYNIFLFLKYKLPFTENAFLDNYSFNDAVEIFSKYKFSELIKINSLSARISHDILHFLLQNRLLLLEIFNESFNYTNHADGFKLDKFIASLDRRNMSDYERLKENNMILNEHLPAVFLTGPKIGFIIVQAGGISKIIDAIKAECPTSQSQFENFNPFIDLISIDKLIDYQKFEINSNMYKATVTKEDLIFSIQYNEVLDTCVFLYLIEIIGDPCGIMNRCNEILLIFDTNSKFVNKKSFSFNYIKGFLLGNNSRSCCQINSEVDSFIYYHNLHNSWMISDLTKFLNPEVYYSDDYHSLWMCISKDKKLNNRFQPNKFYLKSDDEIKISETVMKIQIENGD